MPKTQNKLITSNRLMAVCAMGAVMLAISFASVLARPMAQAQQAGISKEAAVAVEGKFKQIEQSSAVGQPFGTVHLSEPELNSYVKYDLEPLFPPGLSNVQLQLRPGRPQGTAVIDFDKLKGGMKSPPNPLLAYLLQGVHTLGVQGTFSATNGMGRFHLETVTLDGTVLPETVVNYLVDQYLKAHYPTVAIDHPFALAFGIQRIDVQSASVLVASRSLTAQATPLQ
jgi:hypothetical protein